MANTKQYPADTTWANINPDTLSLDVRSLYDEYRQISRFAAEARDKFEAALATEYSDSTPRGSRLAFGYRFGKLSIALVPDDRKPPRASAPATLADFLASKRLGGERA